MQFRSILVLIVFLSTSQMMTAQEEEYDYVLPDSAKSKNSGVRLPIKPKAEDQNIYYVPSYMADPDRDTEMEFTGNESNDPGLKDNSKRTSVNLELGSSVAGDNRGNTAFTTYVAPHVRHQINEDFAVSGGLIVSHSYFDGWTAYSMDGRAYSMPNELTSTSAYMRLDYRVSDRMLVYGAVYKHMATYPSTIGGQNQLDGYGYSLGMEYKMSERSFLQIQIHRSQGYNPMTPYTRTGYGFGMMPVGYYP